MIEEYITSCLEGRVRLRHPALREATTAEMLHLFLANLPGIRNIAINQRTGSLLLEYDPQQLRMQDLLELASGWEEQIAGSEPSCPDRKEGALAGLLNRRVLNRGMLVLLGACLALGLTGRTGGHVATGGLFALLCGAHVYTWRKCL